MNGKARVSCCIVCGGRPLRSGKRRHDPEIHARVRARRERAWYGMHRWPALKVERVLEHWKKVEGRP